VDNYAQILKVNPENAMVRMRMADLLFRLGESENAIKEWDQASAQFFELGDWQSVIRLCEKILELDPSRVPVRDRLSRASLKKDSLAAIESAIESLEDLDSSIEDQREH
jgi:tetratricopeptide (TPR) repeat protein